MIMPEWHILEFGVRILVSPKISNQTLMTTVTVR